MSLTIVDMEWLADVKISVSYLLILLVIVCFFLVQWLRGSKLNSLPGPLGLPFVGYLPFLGKEPYKTLACLRKKYGNVFSVSLGLSKIVVLADYKATEEALSKASTANKPPGLFDLLPGGFGFGSANGEEWTEQRRFAIKTMRDLGLGKNTWTNVIEEEVSDFLIMIGSKNGSPIDILSLLSPSISNNFSALLFGKRFIPGKVFDVLISSADAVMEFFTQSGLWNYFPWLCILFRRIGIPSFQKSYAEMLKFNTTVRNEIENCKMNDVKGSDFVSQYHEVMQESKNNGKETYFNEKNIVGNTQVLFLGGSETVRASLTWLCIAMATYPDIQKKVFGELQSILGEKPMAVWEERTKFPYTYAVIMEGQRWKTLVPLVLRMTGENIKVSGYDIPVGVSLMINMWGLHNDPTYWPNPESFIPERHLTNEGRDVNLKPESYVPFSYGKRKCPGESIAMMEIFLYFTAIMKQFEIRALRGERPKLDGILGLTYQPVHQNLCFIPRR